ncbi:hypothetical protein DFH28DRAFT_893152, partial [Melampsora americana]
IDVFYLSARSAELKLTKHQSELTVAQATLDRLSFGPNQEPNARPCEYYADQWERKRTCLLEFSEENTIARLEKTLARLMDLEEQLHSAHKRVGEIRARRRNQRSESDLADLEDLPLAIVLIEQGIDEVVHELGGNEFKNHPAIRVWNPLCPNRAQPIKMVHDTNLVSQVLWMDSMTVLKVLNQSLFQKECRTWMVWGTRIPTLLLKTQQYSDTTQNSDSRLLALWQKIISDSLKVWEDIVKGKTITAEALDQEEIMEQEFFIGDGAADNPLDREGYENFGENDEQPETGDE